MCSRRDAERLIAEGRTLIERRDAFELVRDQAADHFERSPAGIEDLKAASLIDVVATLRPLITALVFALSIPVALYDPLLGKLFWALLIPISLLLR